jgi:hypothetical protein
METTQPAAAGPSVAANAIAVAAVLEFVRAIERGAASCPSGTRSSSWSPSAPADDRAATPRSLVPVWFGVT